MLRRVGMFDRHPRRPRIHDFRHTFAVKTLLGWYKAGLNVESPTVKRVSFADTRIAGQKASVTSPKPYNQSRLRKKWSGGSP